MSGRTLNYRDDLQCRIIERRVIHFLNFMQLPETFGWRKIEEVFQKIHFLLFKGFKYYYLPFHHAKLMTLMIQKAQNTAKLKTKVAMQFVFSSILLAFPGLNIPAQNCIIKNVTIVDTENGALLESRDVLIEDGKITRVETAIPFIPEILIVPGEGKFLMPGMADAHIHFFQSGGLYTRPDAVDLRHLVPYEEEKAFGLTNAEDYLRRYLRLGITTVIDVGGPMTNFLVRDSIARTTVSPNVLVTGPLFSMISLPQYEEDPPIIKITSEQEADALFDKILPLKPDFIKIWYIAGPNLPATENFPIVKYIAEKTHAHGLKLTVHATELNTAKLAVEAGADILVHSVGDEEIPVNIIQLWKEKNITYIPTLIVSSGYYSVFTGRLPHHAQDLKWANPFVYETLMDPEDMTQEEMPAVLKRNRSSQLLLEEFTGDDIWNANLVNLFRAGVNVATGTDAGNIGTMHASSYIQELEAMQKAGLTNTEILKASTINVARAFGKDHLWGSIEQGQIADLLLLSKNPLESLQHLESIEIVFKNGKILPVDSILVESPEAVVQRQVNAYNARRIDAFLDTYAENIEIFELQGNRMMAGKEEMRARYAGLFKNTPNLYCDIENRIINGNTIIYKEKVRMGDRIMHVVAIYEVEDGKIRRVTFVE